MSAVVVVRDCRFENKCKDTFWVLGLFYLFVQRYLLLNSSSNLGTYYSDARVR